MATTTAATLVARVRRFLGDWPQDDALIANVATTDTSIQVQNNTLYTRGWLIQVGTEAMQVVSLGSNTSTVNVRRGIRGSIAATHNNGEFVVIRPHFLDVEILDALNQAINACYPWIYRAMRDESIATSGGAIYEYTIPAGIYGISQVSFKVTGDLAFRTLRDWDVLRDISPVIRFRRPLPVGTIRLYGYQPQPGLIDLSDSLQPTFPTQAEDCLLMYATQALLASGEARRVREDTGAKDDRENANRIGGSMAASQALLQRFYQRLQATGMPPLPKTIKSVV